jgi:hypothetical protein
MWRDFNILVNRNSGRIGRTEDETSEVNVVARTAERTTRDKYITNKRLTPASTVQCSGDRIEWQCRCEEICRLQKHFDA